MSNLKAICGLVSDEQNTDLHKSDESNHDCNEYISSFLPDLAESFVGKGIVIKGLRRHAKMRTGIIHYRYCHYFVRLEEGKPPKDYYGTKVTPEQQLEKWLEQKRARKITNSL